MKYKSILDSILSLCYVYIQIFIGNPGTYLMEIVYLVNAAYIVAIIKPPR